MSSRRDELRTRLAQGPPIVADGGMGSRLRQLGWVGRTEDANSAAPDVVEEIHRGFVGAGAEMILTNTFTVPFRDPAEYEELIQAAVARARAGAAGAFVIGAVGPTLAPSWIERGALKAARAFADAGVDGLMIETVTPEIRSMEVVERFLFAFDGPRLVSWLPPLTGMTTLDAYGWNCERPETMLGIARRDRSFLLPGGRMMMRPSAGLPTGEGRGLTYPVTPAEFGAFAREAIALGARIIGGCCGSTPAHIAAIAEEVRRVPAG